MTKTVKKGRKLGNHSERLDRLENRLEWVIGEAFQTLADSVAEQASACQAVLKVLAELHPDRRMVKCQAPDGRVFYEFKTVAELEEQQRQAEAIAAAQAAIEAETEEDKPDAQIQPTQH